MNTRPPTRGSMVDPLPHHDAQRSLSVKNLNTVSGSASITTRAIEADGEVAVLVMTASVGATAARARAASCLFELGQHLETPQGVAPHLFQHPAHRAQRLAPGAIDPLPAVHAHVDQAGLGQRAQVHGHRAEGDVGHRLVDGAGHQLVRPRPGAGSRAGGARRRRQAVARPVSWIII